MIHRRMAQKTSNQPCWGLGTEKNFFLQSFSDYTGESKEMVTMKKLWNCNPLQCTQKPVELAMPHLFHGSFLLISCCYHLVTQLRAASFRSHPHTSKPTVQSGVYRSVCGMLSSERVVWGTPQPFSFSLCVHTYFLTYVFICCMRPILFSMIDLDFGVVMAQISDFVGSAAQLECFHSFGLN